MAFPEPQVSRGGQKRHYNCQGRARLFAVPRAELKLSKTVKFGSSIVSNFGCDGYRFPLNLCGESDAG